MDKKLPDYTDNGKTSVCEKHKRFEQNLGIRRNKKGGKLKKKRANAETSRDNKFKNSVI